MSSSPNNRTPQILPRDARDAIEAVFDALSKWRDEIGASTERYSETVLDKMADAARALGWPKELVDASHKHLVQASKAQMQTIDQLMDAWKKQLTAPEANQFMAQLRALPSSWLWDVAWFLASRPLDANSRDVAAQLAVGNVNVDFRFVAAALRRRQQICEQLRSLLCGRGRQLRLQPIEDLELSLHRRLIAVPPTYSPTPGPCSFGAWHPPCRDDQKSARGDVCHATVRLGCKRLGCETKDGASSLVISPRWSPSLRK